MEIDVSFIKLSHLCVLDCLCLLPDPDLIRNQWVIDHIADQISGHFKGDIACLSVANFWVLPMYPAGSTPVYSRFDIRFSEAEEIEYMEAQVRNLIKFEGHGDYVRSFHFVARIRTLPELLEQMKQFQKKFLGLRATQRIYVLGHGYILNGETMFKLHGESIHVNNLLQCLDLLSSFESSKPEVILAFCNGHVCDPHLFPHIHVYPLTNCQQDKTKVVFDTDPTGNILPDSILLQQLANFIACKLRTKIQIVHTIISR